MASAHGVSSRVASRATGPIVMRMGVGMGSPRGPDMPGTGSRSFPAVITGVGTGLPGSRTRWGRGPLKDRCILR